MYSSNLLVLLVLFFPSGLLLLLLLLLLLRLLTLDMFPKKRVTFQLVTLAKAERETRRVH